MAGRKQQGNGYTLKVRLNGLTAEVKGSATEALAHGLYMLPFLADGEPGTGKAAAMHAAARAYLAAADAAYQEQRQSMQKPAG